VPAKFVTGLSALAVGTVPIAMTALTALILAVPYRGEAAGCTAPSLRPATNFGVGGSPVSVAVGDFNGDGHPDVATVNAEPGKEMNTTVSLLLGTGTGSFGTAAKFAAVGHNPVSVGVGDFNGDGFPDLAVANSSDDGLSILQADGQGRFAAVTTTFDVLANGLPVIITRVPVGRGPVSVAVGDFNGDGHLDLAVANGGDNTVSILLGTGTGSFGTATKFAVGHTPDSVAVGDFNGDGHLDLAVANGGDNTVSILLNTCSVPPLTNTATPRPLRIRQPE